MDKKKLKRGWKRSFIGRLSRPNVIGLDTLQAGEDRIVDNREVFKDRWIAHRIKANRLLSRVLAA